MSNKEDNGAKLQQTSPLQGEGARMLVTAAAAFIVLFGLKYTRDFAIPIVMAGFLAVVSYPLTDILRRSLRFPHWLAVVFSVMVDLGLVFCIIGTVKYLAADVISTLQGETMTQAPQDGAAVPLQADVVQQLLCKYEQLLVFLDQYKMGDYVREIVQSPSAIVDKQNIINLTQSITSRIVSFMAVTTLVLILMTFLLGEAPLFMRNFERLPHSMQGKLKMISAIRGVQRYLLIKTLASVCTGLLAWGLCHYAGLPFAFLWGFIACVLNFVPTIGSILAAIPPIVFALALKDWSTMFLVSGGYIAINFAIGNGIEPLFLGKQFGIATSVVLLSVILWGWVWGPIGMLLAVPITMFAKLALENSADLSWVSSIIDDKPISPTSSNQQQ